MKDGTIYILTAVIGMLVVGLVVFVSLHFNKNGGVSIPPVPNNEQENGQSTTTPNNNMMSVNVYLIEIEGGTPGNTIGCGDGLVAVSRQVPQTVGVIRAALEELFSLSGGDYQSDLYNALDQSNVTIESAEVQNGVATVALQGSLMSGGVCDDPRIKEQIRSTILQFPTVTTANVTINGETLDEYFSLQ